MIRIVDNFCPQIDLVARSARAAGFGTWRPNRGLVGSSVYEGMGFWGLHGYMLGALSKALGSCVYPNSMFFRYTTPAMEPAYIHSDRESGAYSCIAYLTEHAEKFGTAFYRHKATGLTEMPPFEELKSMPGLMGDITERPGAFEQTHYVSGMRNRAVVFPAPLFHSRIPLNGIGTDENDARMVWASHFHTPETLYG